MKDVLVSVIIPVYNVERYITRCLQSIIDQTHKTIEVVPVDDGSPDKCGAIIDEFAAKDSRVIPVHKTNGGVSSARNAGLDAARGEYIMFVDGDDYVEADYVDYFLSIITHGGGG
ncbi:MAG: glycosyltransferase family 2 protein, partial [Synergistaceae bacterium]|nr:glycosyltransferase family 2 protein [Synergistaceae bacterium]